MTPNIVGRWQTRLYLIGLLGGMIGLLFVWRYNSFIPYGHRNRWIPEFVVAYVLLIGFVWDLLYQAITRRRWDNDWPGLFFFVSQGIEGVLIFLLIRFVGLPLIPKGSVDFGHFWLEYGVIWLFTYAWVQFIMRAIFLNWRFRQARFGTYPAAER